MEFARKSRSARKYLVHPGRGVNCAGHDRGFAKRAAAESRGASCDAPRHHEPPVAPSTKQAPPPPPLVHVYCAVVLMHDCTRATKMRTIAQCPMLSVSTCAIWVQVPGVVYRRRGVRWGVRWGVRSLRWGSAIIKRPLDCYRNRHLVRAMATPLGTPGTSPGAIHLRPAGLKLGPAPAVAGSREVGLPLRMLLGWPAFT